MTQFEFNDTTIQKLFGVDDAENENPDRLKAYFFKNRAYENLKNSLPIRVVVGHKGIGKSALLKICYIEDGDDSLPAIWLKPDQFSGVAMEPDFNQQIALWKKTIRESIAKFFFNGGEPLFSNAKAGVMAFLLDTLRSKNLNESNKELYAQLTRMKTINVYIDDLDRGWKATEREVNRISALLNAIRDLAGEEPGMRFIIALRTDVYHLVRTSDESTDKIEQNVVRLSWQNHEILYLMALRISLFFEYDTSSLNENLPQKTIARIFDSVIEPRFKGVGHWSNAPMHQVLLSLTRKRPRDLIKLLSSGAKKAYQNRNDKITTSDLESIFTEYSQERFQDLINEFKSEMPNIERLLLGMKVTQKERKDQIGNVYPKDRLILKLKQLMEQNQFVFANRKITTAQSLAEFLYRIEFITARKDEINGVISRLHFSDNQRIMGPEDFGYKWEIHPAYRWALSPSNQNELFQQIRLS